MEVNHLLYFQANIRATVTRRLSHCAYKFIVKYRLPIFLNPYAKKVPITRPRDRTWEEWAHILLGLKARKQIPARIVHGDLMKDFEAIEERSLVVFAVEEEAEDRIPTVEDIAEVLEFVDAGIQVARLLRNEDMRYSLYGIYERLVATGQKRGGDKVAGKTNLNQRGRWQLQSL